MAVTLVIKKSKTGQGVFAGASIARGVVICKMSGKKASASAVEKMLQRGTVAVDDPLQIGEDAFLILDELPRLFNHSCNPNIAIGQDRMLRSVRSIKKGEELRYDYATVVCAHCAWAMPCKCGARMCRGVVGNAATIPAARLRQYIRHGAVPHFIRQELGVRQQSA